MAQQNFGGLGLLAGLSRGLMSALQTYRDEKRYQDDRADKDADRAFRENKLIDDRNQADASRKQSEATLRLNALDKGYDYNPSAAEPVGLFTRNQNFIKERNDENTRKSRETLQKEDTDFTQSTGRVPVRDAQGNIVGTKKLFDKPVSVAQQGSVIVPGFELTPGAKPTKQDAETLKKYNTSYLQASDAITNIKNSLGGFKGSTVIPSEAQQTLAGHVTDLQLQMKELANLGVLNGPDLGLLQRMIPDPTNLATLVKNEGAEGLLRRFDTLKTTLDQKLASTARARGYRQSGGDAKPAGPVPRGVGKVRVSNGKETFEIDPADLDAASKDGFKLVK